MYTCSLPCVLVDAASDNTSFAAVIYFVRYVIVYYTELLIYSIRYMKKEPSSIFRYIQLITNSVFSIGALYKVLIFVDVAVPCW